MATTLPEVGTEGRLHELGQIASLRKNFGFIRCCTRNRELFFHKSQIIGWDWEHVKVGDDVAFQVVHDSETKKLVASQVSPAPQGSAQYHSISEAQYTGIVTSAVEGSSGHGFVLYAREGKPRHLTFSAEVLQPHNPAPSPGSFVTFHVLTDLRAAASAGGVPTDGQHRIHGVQKACQVDVLVSRSRCSSSQR